MIMISIKCLLSILLIAGCSFLSYSQHFHATITSTNLSEDLSVVSSKTDELILLIFHSSDSQKTLPTFYVTELEILSIHKAYTLKIPFSNDPLIWVLLERDSEASIDSITNMVSYNYYALISAFNKRDYSGIEHIIGDDDILGYAISETYPCTFLFNGIYKMDRYSYRMNINRE